MLAAIATALLLGAAPTANLDERLDDTIPWVRERTSVTVLTPKSMPLPSSGIELYPTATATKRRYAIRLSSTPDCEANHCFAASLSAAKGTRLARTTIRLAKGRKGRYTPMACGASCAPPSIAWSERGATYSIEAFVPGAGGKQRQELRRMANSAIRRGPR